MSSIASINKMVSGLNASKKGLQVVSHNITNINTKGYTRQRLLQHETGYQNIGRTATNTMQVGYGVSCTEVKQIRDKVIDQRFRSEQSYASYYQTQSAALTKVDAYFDEPYGANISNLLANLYSAASDLNDGATSDVTERRNFISSAKELIDKINSVNDSLVSYQDNLNEQVVSTVKRINEITDAIKEYNDLISKAEVNEDNANDYRDQRNLLLDELAQYGAITVKEDAGGSVKVRFEGHDLVDGPFIFKLDLEKTQEGTTFVKPIWSDSGEDVYSLNKVISTADGNATGSLQALLVTRGNACATENTNWDDIALNKNFSVDAIGNSFTIPKIQKKLAEYTKELVNLVNSSFSNRTATDAYDSTVAAARPSVGTGIGDWEGKEGVAVFILSKGKYEVNPELLTNNGYNKLGTVSSGQESDAYNDNTNVTNFLNKWTSTQSWFNGEDKYAIDGAIDVTPSSSWPTIKTTNIQGLFAEIVTDIGTENATYTSMSEQKATSLLNIENERQAMSGVSQDEELSNMLKYQYAYNASARVITIMDSMLDTIVNRL